MAEIRGFDLGDDAELLARLDARLPQGLTGEEQLLRGALLLRAGQLDDAVRCFEDAAVQGHARSRALYLESCALRRAERMDEARRALDRAREAAASDGLSSPGELEHARALLEWQAGEREQALAMIDRALEHDPGSAARWLHRGQLLAELDRVDEARKALERAVREEQDLDLAMYERAALEAKVGEVGAAADWLAKACRLRPSHRRRASEDLRFEPVRAEPALSELLVRVRAPAELAWLDDVAPWMGALRRDPDLAALGIEWLTEAESERILPILLVEHEKGPVGTIHTQVTLRRSRSMLATRRAVAWGPVSRSRERVEERCLLFVDAVRQQDGLWLALSESYPPFLWIRVEPRPGGLRRALGEYFPPPRLRRVDMPGRARGFVGYGGRFFIPSPYARGVEPATIAELDRHFSINPFVDSCSWGSAFDDDPWPDEIPEQPGLTLKVGQRQAVVGQQGRGHVWSLTRRTRHSRSYLTIEVHGSVHGSDTGDDIYVAEVRYRPSPHTWAVKAMNTMFGCDYPIDLPVDVVGALMGFQFAGAGDFEAELAKATDPEQIAGLLYVVSALRHDDLGAFALLRKCLEHPSPVVRGTVADIAMAYNYEVLLEEMTLREPDAELQAELQEVLDEGIPIVEHDPFDDGEDVEYQEDDATELEDADVIVESDEPVEVDEVDVIEDGSGAYGGAR